MTKRTEIAIALAIAASGLFVARAILRTQHQSVTVLPRTDVVAEPTSVASASKCMSDASVTGTCKVAVRDKLVAPSTAKFPGIFDGPPTIERGEGCARTWTSWVEAKNALGVPIRSTFICRIVPKTDSISVEIF